MRNNLFTINNQYSKNDIYQILNVPKEKQKGAWDTGYREYEGDIYIFVNIGIEGRTGHDYMNYWDGDLLNWEAKSTSKIGQSQIQSMIDKYFTGDIHIFTRTDNRDDFTYEGIGSMDSYEDTQPVKIVWRFDKPHKGLRRTEKDPNELSGNEFHEGVGKKILVNKYERNPLARRNCIRYYGAKCMVYGFDFEKKYGEIGKGFIHVHHLIPLSNIDESYSIDPVKDLIPICPNCHTMIHRRNPILSVDELREIIKKD